MLNELHGRPSKSRKANPNEPIPVRSETLWDPPDWMNDSQKLGWQFAIDHSPPGLLANIDRGVLAVWVVAEDLHRRATVAQNQSASLMLRSPNAGLPMQSPFLAVINKQGLMMIKAAGELGFSPVSRPRIQAGAPMPVSPVVERPDESSARGRKAVPTLDQFLASHPARHQTTH